MSTRGMGRRCRPGLAAVLVAVSLLVGCFGPSASQFVASGQARLAAGDLPADGSALEVTLVRTPGPGTLVIRSPFPVTASAGGQSLSLRSGGSGVYRASLTAGRRTVTIRNREYFHYEKRTFQIPEGNSIEHRIASPGWADITALPGNCKIHIDGAYVDFVPIIGLPLAAGSKFQDLHF